MVKGDPDRMGMARQSFKDLVEAYLPHGGDGRREHQRVHGR
jgi:hypothetical protein